MRTRLGETRSDVQSTHALICQDSHELIELPHWPECVIVSFAAPALGPQFSFFSVTARSATQIPPPPHDGLRFLLVRRGRAEIHESGSSYVLESDGFACLPPDASATITLESQTEILCLERRYIPAQNVPVPPAFFSSLSGIPAEPIKGDDKLHVQHLLPGGPGYDMEINVMTFEPGASLPYVETHFMEHALMMLKGGGIYRLGEKWYPVAAGDAIWMAPFCPQWFCAIGRESAQYLIFKNFNRDPLLGARA
jgi:(S)-ureidoglycine aminohydrolase